MKFLESIFSQRLPPPDRSTLRRPEVDPEWEVEFHRGTGFTASLKPQEERKWSCSENLPPYLL